MTILRTFTYLVLSVVPAVSCAAGENKFDAHYLANAGVMVARGETKVLFDPFFRNSYGQYDLMPEKMEAAIFDGAPPWDGVDAIFISHHHGDHFDPEVVLHYLKKWPDVHLYAPQQAVTAMMKNVEQPGESLRRRVHAVALERDNSPMRLDLDDLTVEAVRIAHGGWPTRHANVENIAFRVTLDNTATVIHLGDADAGKEHYAQHSSYWQARTTDLALIPVWLMLTDKGRFVLDEYVDAEHEIGIHVYDSIPDDPKERPPEFEGLDIFTQPGETREWK